MPISEDHFTNVPIVATIKMIQSESIEYDACDENNLKYTQ